MVIIEQKNGFILIEGKPEQSKDEVWQEWVDNNLDKEWVARKFNLIKNVVYVGIDYVLLK